MSLTIDDVKIALSQYEVDLEKVAKRLGADAIPYLLELVRGKDILLAGRAAAIAGRFDVRGSHAVVAAAARSSESVVRVAAAAALASLTVDVEELALALLADECPGVRKWTLKSVSDSESGSIQERIRLIAESDPSQFLRNMAQRLAGAA